MKKILYLLIALTMTGACAQNWQPLTNGLSGAVRTLVPDDLRNKLYVGGEFSFVNGYLDRSLTSWNGSRFDSAEVFACNPLYSAGLWQGRLYATDCNDMYVYDNVDWSLLDSNFSGSALCYTHNDSLLFVGGFFDRIGDDYYGCLASWDGHYWRNIPLPYMYGTVNDIAIFHDTIYVVAVFPDTSGESFTKILRRTCGCQGWVDISSVIAGTRAWVSSLEVYSNELYAAGYFSKADGSVGNSIARYDGSMWHEVGNGIDQSGTYGQVYTLAAIDSVLLVGGYFQSTSGVQASNIASWNGSQWSSLGGAFNQSILTICKWQNAIYVGGRFTMIDSTQCSYVAKYNH